jgi:hypothetical protein
MPGALAARPLRKQARRARASLDAAVRTVLVYRRSTSPEVESFLMKLAIALPSRGSTASSPTVHPEGLTDLHGPRFGFPARQIAEALRDLRLGSVEEAGPRYL